MATDALRHFKGFMPGTSDGGPEWFFGDSIPTREDWETFIRIGKKTKIVEEVHEAKTRVIKDGLFLDLKEWSIEKNAWVDVRVPAKMVAVIEHKTQKCVECGFVRRRNPAAGRTKAAYKGEPIPIPQWVLDELGQWIGATFKALPSGKPRPVLKPRR